VNQRTLAAILMLAMTEAHAGSVKLRGELALGYDSNVANARQGGQDREDGFVQVNAGAEKLWGLGSRSALQARFDLESQAYNRYEGLDSAKGVFTLRYLFRPGRGFYSPTFGLAGSGAWWEFDSSVRDSADYRASLFVLEQMTTRISARITGGVNWRRSLDTDVFDLRTKSAGVDLDWTLSNHFALYGGFQRRWGQFVTTRPTPPAPVFMFTADDVFDGEFAVRQEGAANVGTLGFNIALSPMFALDVQGFYVEAGANTGVHYRRTQALASVLARF
jgi:hypothetical protein